MVVRPVLFLLLGIIFVPKVDTPETFSLRGSDLCFRCGKRGHWASVCPAKDKPFSSGSKSWLFGFWSVWIWPVREGHRRSFLYSRKVAGKLSCFGLMYLELESLFLTLFRMVTKFFFGNRPYRIWLRIDIRLCIREVLFRERFLTRGCIRETPVYGCNPLHVAVQSSGKLGLILDLSHQNKFIVWKSVKYKDLGTVLQMFPPGMSVFSFDLKSATSISVRSTRNFCRLSGLLLMEAGNFTNLSFCLLVWLRLLMSSPK